MTLVQVLANETSVHMACDFRLTNPYTNKVEPNDAHKLISASTPSMAALIGVTGVAILDGRPVGQWLAEVVSSLDPGKHVDELIEALTAAERSLATISDASLRRTTFVVASMVGSQSMVSLVSNFETFIRGQITTAATAGRSLIVSRVKPKGAAFFATGTANKIRSAERDELMLALRSGAPDGQIQEQMRSLNEAVSTRTGTVSPGCYVASLHATGQRSARPFLTAEQQGDFIPPEFAEQLKRSGLRLNRKIGPDGRPMPIRMVGSSSARAGGSPENFREQFKLRPNDAELWNNYGAFLWGRKRYEESVEAFQKAVDLNPNYSTALANLASKIWVRRQDTVTVDDLYSRAVAASEPSVPAWIMSDYAIFCDEGLSDPGRAGDLHERAAHDENFPLALARQALFLLKIGNDAAAANNLLTQALAKQPNDPQILIVSGQADWFYNNDPKAAQAKLHKACSLDPANVNALGLAGDICLQMNDSASAAYYYRKLIKRGQSDAQVQANYGLALLMERKPDGALRHLAQGGQADPANPAIRANRAATLWVLRRQGEAIRVLRELLDAKPPPHIELEALAMLCIASPADADIADQRVHQLIAAGIRGDGKTVRCMVRDSPRDKRQAGYNLADLIEGSPTEKAP
jgi:Tfp pilus assembly protein PilF